MFGMMGAAAITKKRGGYTNTKLHGMMAWAGLMLAGGGFYVIYKHKNVMGKDHFTTLHSWGEFSSLPFLFRLCVIAFPRRPMPFVLDCFQRGSSAARRPQEA
jgi:LPXTG-motif cell wall-anchored protein